MVPCEQPREASSAWLCEACSASVERDGAQCEASLKALVFEKTDELTIRFAEMASLHS